MRKINSLVVHHSVTDPNNKDIWAVSIDGKDYHEGYIISNQEYKGNYHYLIYQDGEVKQPIKDHEHYTYHCGNYDINLTSLAICFVGNFEENEPSGLLLKACWNTIDVLSALYRIDNVYLHRDLYNTACPGKYITLDKIKEAGMTIPRESVDRAFLSIVKRHMTEDDYATYMNAKNEVEMLHLVANSIEHNEMYNDAVKYRKGDTRNDKYEKYNGDLYKKIS